MWEWAGEHLVEDGLQKCPCVSVADCWALDVASRAAAPLAESGIH